MVTPAGPIPLDRQPVPLPKAFGIARWVDDPAAAAGCISDTRRCPGGCQREFSGVGHRHCCSLCSVTSGQGHTRRCDKHQRWLAHGRRGALRIMTCGCHGCDRPTDMFHETCCSKCSPSRSERHSHRCDRAYRAFVRQAAHDRSPRMGRASSSTSYSGSQQIWQLAHDIVAEFSQSVPVSVPETMPYPVAAAADAAPEELLFLNELD